MSTRPTMWLDSSVRASSFSCPGLAASARACCYQPSSAICGITQKELLAHFKEGIEALSLARNESREDTIEALRQKYDSYRFTDSEELVYNSFSLLCTFSHGKMANYWIKTGVSKVFVKYLTRSVFDLIELERLWVKRNRMEAKYSNEDSIPLLFQTGYLTIKDVDGDFYRLGIPNGEVRDALVDQLIPTFLGISNQDFSLRLKNLKNYIDKGQVENWIGEIQGLISTIPGHLFGPTDSHLKNEGQRIAAREQSIEKFERTYHLIVHVIFQMLSVDSRSEIEITGGRIDMVVRCKHYLYVMDFKLDGTPQEALNQIDTKEYLLPWQADGHQVFKIGIVFSSHTHNISGFESRLAGAS
ncbi:MAG: ATP-binding protein [Bacteroidales bacterium]|nr:ATP-binding protein [Bacteroidales bacterium]